MSQLLPIDTTAGKVDFSDRPAVSTTVVASPATNAETIVASVAVPNNLQVLSGVRLTGWVSFTAGTSGTAATLRLRQTSVSGTLVLSSGALTVVAANIYAFPIFAFDATGVAATVYKLTLQVTGGAAASTVSAVFLEAFAE